MDLADIVADTDVIDTPVKVVQWCLVVWVIFVAIALVPFVIDLLQVI